MQQMHACVVFMSADDALSGKVRNINPHAKSSIILLPVLLHTGKVDQITCKSKGDIEKKA